MVRTFIEIWRKRDGQDLIEYALLCALVASGTGILLPMSIMTSMSQIYSRVTSLMDRFGGGGG